MKLYTLLSFSFLMTLLGNTATQADTPYCKTLSVQNNLNNPSIVIYYTKCGKVSDESILYPGEKATLSAEPNTPVHIDVKSGLLHYTVWPETKIGDGWTIECQGSYNHAWCESKPTFSPSNCKAFHIVHNGHYYLQPEYIECTSGNLLKPHLSTGDVRDYLVKPGTDVQIGISNGLGDKSSIIWGPQPINNGTRVDCEGTALNPSCAEMGVPAAVKSKH